MTKRINKNTVTDPAQLVKLLGEMNDTIDGLVTHTNAIQTALVDGAPVTSPRFTIGAQASGVGWSAFDFALNGNVYKIAAGSGTLTNAKTAASGTYGACAIDAGTDLTVDVISAAINSGGATTAASGLANLAACDSGHVRVATLVYKNSGDTFVTGTTTFSGAAVTATFANEANLMTLLTTTNLTAASNTVEKAK